uniref:Uncharacterized protein n=1 Tax=Anguilla anguilla TaxID=7936 RepID=A0A0E9UD86_ANGAN
MQCQPIRTRPHHQHYEQRPLRHKSTSATKIRPKSDKRIEATQNN